MAEDPQGGGERQFEPTQHRLDEFRSEGRVAISRDVLGASHLLALAVGFSLFGGALVAGGHEAIRVAARELNGDPSSLLPGIVRALEVLGWPTLGLALVGLVGVLVAGFTQTRLLFAWKLIGFKWSRLNPGPKLAELLGPKKGSIRVGLALAKVSAAGLVVFLVLAGAMGLIPLLGLTSVSHPEALTRQLLWQLLLGAAAVFGAVAVLDYLWQRSQLREKLYMTAEEVKRDQWENEGRPEVKQRRRQAHRDLSLNRIIQAVPEADVIVTNPTHLAVALRYRPGEDAAPLVTAKGADSVAAHIRYLARRHGVPILEDKPLARALWRRVRVGRAIPRDLFEQVATLLARVFRARPRASAAPASPPRGAAPGPRGAPR